MKAMMILDCDNAAFGETREDTAAEVGAILMTLYGKLQEPNYGRTFEPLRDSNGNIVGQFCLKGEADPGYQDLARGIKYKD